MATSNQIYNFALNIFIMLKLLITSLFFLITISSYSQVQELREYKNIPEEQIILNINLERWVKTPQQMDLKPYSVGFDAYFMQPTFWENRNISFAIGGGISVQNIKNNCQITDSLGFTLFKAINDTISYQTNKLSTVYVDVPFELRFRTRPIVKKRNFKFVVGFKVGYNFQRYLKYQGDNFINYTNDSDIKYKTYKVNNILHYRYGVFTRIGYGKFNLTAYYALVELFNKQKAPEIIPYSIGLSISLF